MGRSSTAKKPAPRDAASKVAQQRLSAHWQTLPEEARVTLTELIIRLILDHAAGAQAPCRTAARRCCKRGRDG